jgi:hypothetical protein
MRVFLKYHIKDWICTPFLALFLVVRYKKSQFEDIPIKISFQNDKINLKYNANNFYHKIQEINLNGSNIPTKN